MREPPALSQTSRCLISISAAAALAVLLAGCQRAEEKAAEKKDALPAAWALDESKLQQPIRFTAADLDTSQNACKDLSAYANGKWLAANAIPADESGWGARLVALRQTFTLTTMPAGPSDGADLTPARKKNPPVSRRGFLSSCIRPSSRMRTMAELVN